MRSAVVLAALLSAGAPVAEAGERVALVMGNASYRPGYELRNPINDARGIADKLSNLGFQVTLLIDGDLATAQRALDAFAETGAEADAALIFYAGHGMMMRGRNFMLPVDFELGNLDAEPDREALDTERMLQVLSSTHAKVKLLWFDACRNNPVESRGAVVISAPAEAEARTENTMIAFSTAQGRTAADGTGSDSPFAEALIRDIDRPDLELRDLMRDVRIHVRDATGSAQTMWVEDSMTVDFYFTPEGVGSLSGLTNPEPLPQVTGLIFPDSSERLLSDAELAGLDAATLRLARNEIFARNGRYFREPELSRHFSAFAWYQPFTWEPQLSSLERQNVALIRQYELSGTAVSDGFIFPDSDRRLLAAEDMRPLSKPQLRIARNEIYARHGRKFKDRKLTQYFSQFAWYKPQFGEIELTYLEQQNVKLIQRYEAAD